MHIFRCEKIPHYLQTHIKKNSKEKKTTIVKNIFCWLYFYTNRNIFAGKDSQNKKIYCIFFIAKKMTTEISLLSARCSLLQKLSVSHISLPFIRISNYI